MDIPKKLQVFISSTYLDLREERQAAVEAILTAGHIPAGMELFVANDESQMETIKRWIDESDVFMLILGGRYGSFDGKRQKSYIQIEYEYALKKKKPLFTVVISEEYLKLRVKKSGTKVVELDHPDKLKKFRQLVCSKMVREWNNTAEIKNAIMETLAKFSQRPNIFGWIRNDKSINTMVDLVAKLSKDNYDLREQLKEATTSVSATVTPLELENFLQDIYDVYTQMKMKRKLLYLDTLRKKLSKKYSKDRFTRLFIAAKQLHPLKVGIHQDSDQKPFVIITTSKDAIDRSQ